MMHYDDAGCIRVVAEFASKAFEGLSGKSFPDFIEGGGNLVDALELMREGAALSDKSLIDMFGSIEAGKAVMALAEGDEFAANLVGMADAAGATDEAFQKMNETFGRQFAILKTQLQRILIEVGLKILPVATKAVGFFSGALRWGFGAVSKFGGAVANFLRPAFDTIGKLAHLFQVGFKGGSIGGEWSKVERAAFTLGQKLKDFTGYVGDLLDQWDDLSHLFKLGFDGGKIGGEFSDLERFAFNAGEKVRELRDILQKIADVIRERVIPPLRDMANIFRDRVLPAVKDVFLFLKDHKDIIYAVGGAIAIVMIPAIWGWVTATIANTAAHVALAVATLAAYLPILLLIAVIALLVYGIIQLVRHWDDVTAFLKDAWDAAVGFIIDKVIWLKDKFFDIITGLKNWLFDNWRSIVLGILAIVFPPGAGLFWIITHFGTVKEKVMDIMNRVKRFFTEDIKGFFTDTVPGWFKTMGDGIANAAKAGLNTMLGFYESGVNRMISGLNKLLSGVSKVAAPFRGVLGKVGIDIPDIPSIPPVSIPRLDMGAEILRTGLAVVHRRETILPAGVAALTPAAAGGITITGNTFVFGGDSTREDAEEFLDMVEQGWRERRLRGT